MNIGLSVQEKRCKIDFQDSSHGSHGGDLGFLIGIILANFFLASFQISSQLAFWFMRGSYGLGGSVGCASDWRPGGCGFDPRRGRQHSFVEIDHEIFSTVILSLLLIQEGQLSVSGERMCTILVNRLED